MRQPRGNRRPARDVGLGAAAAAGVCLALLCGGCSPGGGRLPAASFGDFDRRARAGEPLSVVFFGGSLTWGANATAPNRTSYRGLMAKYLRAKYPRSPLAFHDAAIGGTGSRLGLFRLQRDVLAYKPDLVVYEFTVNDDAGGTDLPTLACYETMLREMIGKGIAVMQVFTAFRYDYGGQWDPLDAPRYKAHVKLARAYHTAVGDCRAHLKDVLSAEKHTPAELWPIDGVHPGDAGYGVFFEAVRDGFERAVREGRRCVVPARPVFSDAYGRRTRLRLVDRALPAGWKRAKAFRTSMWFDGLSSRWMDDVAVCDVKDRQAVKPLVVAFRGTYVAVFGEMDEDGLSFEAFIDGRRFRDARDKKHPPKDAWEASAKRFGKGRLFFFRPLADGLAPGPHKLEIRPVFPDGASKGQLRIESVMFAGG